MLYNNCNSDHGYGSISSCSPWTSHMDLRWPPLQPRQTGDRQAHKSSSDSNLVSGRRSLEDVMLEFQMNGSDSPYEEPEEDGGGRWGTRAAHDVTLSGMGPHSAYLRQKSWPAPECSPAPPLPRAAPNDFATSTPLFDEVPAFTPLPLPPRAAAVPPPPPAALALSPAQAPALSPAQAPALSPAQAPALSSAQARVLASLPPALLDALLRQLQQEKRFRSTGQECRFCKNNGERESFYRSHVLKDARGRVACPVLRAFRCQRCGASGDQAHTIKYCPLSTNEERIKSTYMMRSVRMASGRRRAHAPPVDAGADYVLFGEPPRSMLCDSSALEPLDPLWAALEQKLNSKMML